MIIKESRNSKRLERHRRIRKRVVGDSAKPRLVVFRSHKHIYAQVIDDLNGKTIVSASSMQDMAKGKIADEMKKKDVASLVGKELGALALKAGIEEVVFDRNGYKYHGRVAALADGAREAGLKF
ncbi:MAG: 50S ribosomal protein L18 [Firmicutes bacterium]|nr:50S ribosomal protein L18 [Bacillota bacterium]